MITYKPAINLAVNESGHNVCPFCGQYLPTEHFSKWVLHDLGGGVKIRIRRYNCKQRPKRQRAKQIDLAERI